MAPLGAGGMGEVWEAWDARLERRVAVKLLKPEVAADADGLARFEREARAVAALNHPNILTIHDVGVEDGRPYVVTELLSGQSLREVISGGTPTQRQVLAWAAQAAKGLAAAHQKGIVHRDLKPDNVFLTAEGLVKILDFGLAKQSAASTSLDTAAATDASPTTPGLLLGTIAYMSPEQARGEPVDARSDIFSFGVMLHELLAGKHPFRRDTPGATLAAILQDTPRPLSAADPAMPRALDGILARCLEKDRAERFQGAHDLGLALEAVLAAPTGSPAPADVEERSPYPGIASFTERDAALFFGRETETKALWQRIRSRLMLAVIGPSGAGKSSFLRAGVVAARPHGWAAAVATPGASPFRGLGRALAPELATDADALRLLVNVDDPETAFQLASRWRKAHAEALLVVDQFEELFTLSARDVQESFAALLARLAGEAGIHVVLSLRDDFLMACHAHPALSPVFQELTPLGPLTREGLRRALAEPARKRGTRFEDEALVDEMVGAVEGERGALPLLAFAVSRLWERRDRERRLLTREAYVEIGGVAGALAQHAEATMDRIGTERHGIVREIFRNLVTAQGTRAVMERDELLSAFPDRAAAGEVLRALVDARLLTSYDLETAPGTPERHRIEVVHESLLKAWPRLVRWQAQDEEGSVLRDQLRQAARLWEDKGRTADLLWSGTAFQEFELWRGRYPGALTAVEEDFGKAMRGHAQRRRRLQTFGAAAAIVVLSAVALAIGVSRQQARGEARRAEASKLLAIGQERLADDPTEALAFTAASLELADSREARIFAMRALWDTPPALELAAQLPLWTPRFSPDGRLLAVGGYMSDSRVLPEDGGTPRILPQRFGVPHWLPGHLALDEDQRISLWSRPGFKLERVVELGGTSWVAPSDARLLVQTQVRGKEGRPEELALRSVAPETGALTELGRVPAAGPHFWSPDGASWLIARGPQLVSRPLPLTDGGPEAVLGEHPPEIAGMRPLGKDQILTFNRAREARLWTLLPGQPAKSEPFELPTGLEPPFQADASWFFKMTDQSVRLWRRGVWPAARPLALRRALSWWSARVHLTTAGDWLAASTDGYGRLTFWPLRKTYPLVVDGYRLDTKVLAFSPDGRWLATTWPGAPIRLWPLTPGAGAPRTLALPGVREINNFVFDPSGRFLFCVTGAPIGVFLVPLDGRPPVDLEGFARAPWMWAAAVSPSGRLVATARYTGQGDHALRIWDLEQGSSRALDLPRDPKTNDDAISTLAFDGETALYSSGSGGIRRWDLTAGRQELVIPGAVEGPAVFRLRYGLALTATGGPCAKLTLHDLAKRTSRELPGFGDCVGAFDLDAEARVLVTFGRDGVRAGRLEGGEPHLLAGHKGAGESVLSGGLAISPDLKWVASGGGDSTLRLWPMPDLDKPPLHTLPRAELIAKLRTLTNLQAVRDPKARAGWKIEVGRFPGWKEQPTW